MGDDILAVFWHYMSGIGQVQSFYYFFLNNLCQVFHVYILILFWNSQRLSKTQMVSHPDRAENAPRVHFTQSWSELISTPISSLPPECSWLHLEDSLLMISTVPLSSFQTLDGKWWCLLYFFHCCSTLSTSISQVLFLPVDFSLC